MHHDIRSFGGDGSHDIRFRDGQHEHVASIKRDLWFDRDVDSRWIVWAQERTPVGDGSPADDSPESSTLGAIIVTNPIVMEFLGQLAELLLAPACFGHEPVFEPSSPQANLPEAS